MTLETTATRQYSVTYTFNENLRQEHGDAVSLITETITEMQRDGIDIEFLGATQELNAVGRTIEVTARYTAPSKGTIGRLNCRARLPASAQPRREKVNTRKLVDHQLAVAGR